MDATTTTLEISDAMIEAIQAITPRFEHERATLWKYTPSERVNGRAKLENTELRSFDLVWTPGVRSFLWYGNGEAYMADVRVATSYRGVTPDLLAHMIQEDGVDLLRVTAQLPEPVVPGLSHFEQLGVGGYEIDDRGNAIVEHVFRAHWAQFTD